MTTVNPDCWSGKHDACNGDAWSAYEDRPADCCCTCHDSGDPNVTAADQPLPRRQPMSAGIASDDFRDAAATGAWMVARRIELINSWDIPITATLVADVARGVWHEYGGQIVKTEEEPHV